MQLNITKEDLRFFYLLSREKEYTLCSIAEASDLVENEKHTSNHAQAMKIAVEYGEQGYLPDSYDILQLHGMLFPYGGEWRTTEIRFNGCESCPPPAYKVPGLMREYVNDVQWWLDNSREDEYIRLAHLHIEYEWIHCFSDGNGRLGRILTNCYAAYLGLPFIKITRQDKAEYIRCLEDKDENGLANLFIASSL